MTALLLVAGLFGFLLAMMVQTAPEISAPPGGSQPFLAATRTLLHDGVAARPDGQRIKLVALTENDLTALVNFALLRKHWQGYALASIHGGRLDVTASIRLPIRSADLYLNLKLVADDAQPQAVIKRLRVGRLSLPAPVVRGLIGVMRALTSLGRYAAVGERLLREVRIGDERLQLALNWDQETVQQLRALVVDVASQERMLVYQQRLGEALAALQGKRYASLAVLMQSLFALADERSALPESEPMEENRAIILVLGAYVNNRELLREAGGASVRLPRRGVLLSRRIDMAQHFMGSAALAISGHRALADVVGMAKEINDTHSGSGFSFTDLAADRAGALFGKVAVRSADEARRVQSLLKAGTDESVFMPSIKDLPENLDADAFAQRYGTIESEPFLALKQQIETRITACPLYQGVPL
ncbi:hypothetical protein [Methylococcus sp. EFPC2]|uniref:hypothetical protein n=1 Tax=Methylococcus sp. EFPC2 TaxID=2812648 RepID=UPI0019682EB5|nr:hypothetical protein [Methylococcus sp. EFPC2]QSA96771.1 hypothetical protein JWZ97_16420 [Methylococcus sp. EFPC2]